MFSALAEPPIVVVEKNRRKFHFLVHACIYKDSTKKYCRNHITSKHSIAVRTMGWG